MVINHLHMYNLNQNVCHSCKLHDADFSFLKDKGKTAIDVIRILKVKLTQERINFNFGSFLFLIIKYCFLILHPIKENALLKKKMYLTQSTRQFYPQAIIREQKNPNYINND